MVQGLGFLSKKSWHTKNLNNQEKVWIAEQQQEQERIRTTELAKQIQIEREQNEINDITGGNTKKKTYDRGIDWMYTGQTKDSQIAKEDAQKMAEEYLLGKPIAFHGATGTLPVTAAATTMPGSGSNRTIDAVVGMNNDATTTTKLAATSEPVPHETIPPTFKNNHKYEDPMYAVSLQTVRKEKMIEHQKELYQKVGIVTVPARENVADNTSTNGVDMDPASSKTKAHKKSKKKKSKKYDSDDSRHRKHSKRSSRDYSERHRTNQSSNGKRKRYNDDDASYDSRDSGSSYSDDRNRKRSSSRHGYSRADSYRDERHRHRDYDNDAPRASQPPPLPQQQEEMKVSGYGLVKKHTTSSTSEHHYNRHENRTKDLGPDMELIQRKRQEKNKSHHHHHYGTEQTRHRPKNPEERARALRAMEENAKSYDATRQRRPTPTQSSDSHKQSLTDHATTGTGATFLHEISQKVHGVYDQQKSL